MSPFSRWYPATCIGSSAVITPVNTFRDVPGWVTRRWKPLESCQMVAAVAEPAL